MDFWFYGQLSAPNSPLNREFTVFGRRGDIMIIYECYLSYVFLRSKAEVRKVWRYSKSLFAVSAPSRHRLYLVQLH